MFALCPYVMNNELYEILDTEYNSTVFVEYKLNQCPRVVPSLPLRVYVLENSGSPIVLGSCSYHRENSEREREVSVGAHIDFERGKLNTCLR